MFRKSQNKTKKALTKVGALIEAVIEIIGDVLNEIFDFD